MTRLAWLFLWVLLVAPVRADGDEENPNDDDGAPIPYVAPPVEICLELLGDDREQDAREGLANKSKAEVTACVQQTLARMDDKTPPTRILGAAIWAAGNMEPDSRADVIAQLTKQAQTRGKNPLRPVCLEALGPLGHTALAQLLAQHVLSGSGPEVLGAARGLCRNPRPEGVVKLLEAAAELETRLAEPGEPSDPEAGEPPPRPDEERLTAVLTALRWSADGPHGVKLVAAVRSLTVLPSPRLLEPLFELRDQASRKAAAELGGELLERPEPLVRGVGVRLLIASQTSEAREQLVELLRDDTPAVRLAAAKGVGDLGVREAIPRLIALLDDESNDVRVAAHRSLVQFARLEIPGRKSDWETWWAQEQARQQQE